MLIRFRYKNSIHEYFFQNVLLCLEATWKSFKWTNKLNNCNSKHSSLLYNFKCKEGRNWGHGLSAAIKLGSLEKTVITSLFHSGLYPGIIFLWKNRGQLLFWRTTGYAVFWQKKRPKNFMMPNWFFDQVPNKGSALGNPCLSWTKMEESRLWGS